MNIKKKNYQVLVPRISRNGNCGSSCNEESQICFCVQKWVRKETGMIFLGQHNKAISPQRDRTGVPMLSATCQLTGHLEPQGDLLMRY